jgi:hypothetical protein
MVKPTLSTKSIGTKVIEEECGSWSEQRNWAPAQCRLVPYRPDLNILLESRDHAG